MFNKVILLGNCTKDGELKFSQGGMGIYKNSLAVSRKFSKDGVKKEEVLFIDFTAFARTSEICNQYLRKGSKILVEGRLNFEQWNDQDGQKRSKHSVTVETLQMLDSKGDSTSNDNNSYQQPQQQQQSQAPQQQQSYQQQPQQQSRQMPSSDSVPVIDINEDEIPF